MQGKNGKAKVKEQVEKAEERTGKPSREKAKERQLKSRLRLKLRLKLQRTMLPRPRSLPLARQSARSLSLLLPTYQRKPRLTEERASERAIQHTRVTIHHESDILHSFFYDIRSVSIRCGD